MNPLLRSCHAAAAIVLMPAAVWASTPLARSSSDEPKASERKDHESPSDLGFSNLFTTGWDEEWSHRHDRNTPDMALLRVTTNALEKEFRLDYAATDVRENPKVDTTRFANGLIAYAINRRLMLEVINNFQWNRDFKDTTTSGGGGGGLVRLQLVDTKTSCTSFQFKVAAPNKGLGQTQTILTYAIASWQDLQALWPGLGQLGLYESIQYDKLDGPAKVGAKSKGMSGDVSLAKTWTDGSAGVFKKFTTFAEFTASRDLDGPNQDITMGGFTPGIRTWLSKNNSLTLGVDLPLGHRTNFYRVARVTYILNF